MAFFNARAPIGFRWANTLLLDAAQYPEKYSELIYGQAKVAPGNDPRSDPMNPGAFVALSRQCCAAIVINCAAELWSVLAHGLLGLEPSNQMTEDVKQFLKRERLSNLAVFEHYFKLCGEAFRGTRTHEDLRLIYDLRDAIMHDRPDDANVEIEQETDKWIRRLRSRLSEEDLAWLPEIPTVYPSGRAVPAEDSRVPVMNLMRYPLARWVIDTTKLISSEMSEMLLLFPGPKRLVSCIVVSAVPRSLAAAPIAKRIQVGGISKQLAIGDPGDAAASEMGLTATD